MGRLLHKTLVVAVAAFSVSACSSSPLGAVSHSADASNEASRDGQAPDASAHEGLVEVDARLDLPLEVDARVLPICGVIDPGPFARYQMSDLPAGACEADGAPCTVYTMEPCPTVGFYGPLQQWDCVCAAHVWSCVLVQQGKRSC